MKTYFFSIIILFALACGLESCTSFKKENTGDQDRLVDETIEKTSVDYASGFTVSYKRGYKIVHVANPWQGSTEPVIYTLRSSSTPQDDSIKLLGKEIIIPLESIICNSTSHITLLEALELEDKLSGFAQTKYIYSKKIRNLVKLGKVAEIGIEAQMNIEKILATDSDAVMAFNAGPENKQLKKLKEIGVNLIMNADYLETTLLGRAEWLKFMALFFDKEKEANVLFDQLVYRYDSLIGLVDTPQEPTVLSGTVYGSTWFMPSGGNYNARLIDDAGGSYLWKDDTRTGWLNLDFEVVYERASEADYWIGAADFKSLYEMKNVDERYGDFKAFRNGNVYTYTKRITSSGANDYFESGNINPDLILADHIKILHPELLPGYELSYYKKLN